MHVFSLCSGHSNSSGFRSHPTGKLILAMLIYKKLRSYESLSESEYVICIATIYQNNKHDFV